MVVSSEGQEIDILVKDDLLQVGTIVRIENHYAIIAYMSYHEDDRVGSKQKLIARAQVFGEIIDDKLIRIKKPLKPYKEVYSADQESLECLLRGESNISIGSVYSTSARAYIDPVEYDRHIAILASTGSGKSYTTANIVKEFSSLSLPVVIVDTHGEYQKLLCKLVEGTDIDIEVYTVKQARQGYKEFKIPVCALRAQDFSHFTSINETQKAALALVLDKLDSRDNYTLDDIVMGCSELDAGKVHEETAKALERRLRSLKNIFSGVFDMYGTDIKKLVEPYKITLIDASYAPQGVRQSVVSYLSKHILEERIKSENGNADAIPYKLLFVVEEAHNYAGSKLSHSCKRQLQRIASEGRKFGVGLCVISQKPSKIDEEILSQCNTGIYMHLTNPGDKDHIRRSFESINDEIIKDLDSLDPGECIIAGAMSRIPFVMCKVDRINIKEEKKQIPCYEKPKKYEIAGSDEYI